MEVSQRVNLTCGLLFFVKQKLPYFRFWLGMIAHLLLFTAIYSNIRGDTADRGATPEVKEDVDAMQVGASVVQVLCGSKKQRTARSINNWLVVWNIFYFPIY